MTIGLLIPVINNNSKIMIQDSYNLNRFLDAQDDMYPIALRQMQEGRKRSHWMWYIFPQLKHLGHSYNSNFYGISSVDEATAYLDHPILGQRLKEISKTIYELSVKDIEDVLGTVDSMKLRSSMTLFNIACPNDVFAKVLDKYFKGQPDDNTIQLLMN